MDITEPEFATIPQLESNDGAVQVGLRGEVQHVEGDHLEGVCYIGVESQEPVVVHDLAVKADPYFNQGEVRLAGRDPDGGDLVSGSQVGHKLVHAVAVIKPDRTEARCVNAGIAANGVDRLGVNPCSVAVDHGQVSNVALHAEGGVAEGGDACPFARVIPRHLGLVQTTYSVCQVKGVMMIHC